MTEKFFEQITIWRSLKSRFGLEKKLKRAKTKYAGFSFITQMNQASNIRV